jgi:hypothetical protein
MSANRSHGASILSFTRAFAAVAMLASAAACGSDSTAPLGKNFLDGANGDPQIGVVLNSLGKSLSMFQLGSPTTQEEIPLGTSSTVTPVGFSIGSRNAAVPLGNAASVALVDLESASTERFFTFPSGNATGSVFVDDTAIFAANSTLGIVGRMYIHQTGDAISDSVRVAPQPSDLAYAAGRVLVVSANLDENFAPIGNGIVTAIDPATMEVLGTVELGGTNSGYGAVGPDGLLYVVNTGDYVSDGSITIVDPATLEAITTVPGMGAGPGEINIDANGLAYISSVFGGTVVWNTVTKSFVRGPDDPVCAPLAGGGCRGAFASTASSNGDVYQAYFGSAADGLAPYIFVYDAGSYALRDSISVGSGPAALAIRTF